MTKTYGLKGNIVSFSEKSFKAIYDENWNYTIDTIEPYCFIANRFFDNTGEITQIEYYNKDSVLQTKVIYEHGNFKKKINSYQFDKNGYKISFTRIVSFEDSTVFVETIDFKTKITTSNSWTKYENNQISWQKSVVIKDSLSSEWVYIRNEKGQEIEIKTKFGFNNQQDYRIVSIKYLEFDNNGNWTKRIEYNPADGNTCMVKIRKIKYNE